MATCGVKLILNSRNEERLYKACNSLRQKTGAEIVLAAADITTDDRRKLVMEKAGDVDILANNSWGRPIGYFKNWDREDWIRAINENMFTFIEMIKAVIESTVSKKFGRIVNITSGSVKSPIPELGLSNGARSGLTNVVAGIAREYEKYYVIITNLLPSQFHMARIEAWV